MQTQIRLMSMFTYLLVMVKNIWGCGTTPGKLEGVEFALKLPCKTSMLLFYQHKTLLFNKVSSYTY